MSLVAAEDSKPRCSQEFRFSTVSSGRSVWLESTHLDAWLKAITASPKPARDTGVHLPFNDGIPSLWGRKDCWGSPETFTKASSLISSTEPPSVTKLAGKELQLVYC